MMDTCQLRSAIALIVLLCIGAHAVSPKLPFSGRQNADSGSIFSRLPNDTRPVSYDIHLKTRVDQGDLNFSGHVKIVVQIVNDTNEIVLHARQLEIKNISLTKVFFVPEEIAVTYSYDSVTEFLTIRATDKILTTAAYYYLNIEYAGELRKDNAGFYVSTFTDANNKEVNIAATQFQLDDARHAFPCYDEPQIKAVFKLTIHRGSSYTAVSNMPIIKGPTDNEDGTSTTEFQQTTLMSSYLVAITVTNFGYDELQGRIPHRIYSRKETQASRKFALTTSVAVLEAIEDYVGVDYKLPKLDNMAIPDFAAYAMENWGLSMYREEFLLFDDRESTTQSQIDIIETMSHEFGHQWFGNLVSPNWWTYLWLNEGFATIFSYMAADEVFSEWDFMQRFHVREFQFALEMDANPNSPALSKYCNSISDLSFAAYSKAGSVLIMIRHAITDEVFRKALNYYLTDREYESADEDDLYRNFQKAIDEENIFLDKYINFVELFKTWSNQGGYPIITVTRDYKKGSFVIKQSPFDKTSQAPSSDRRSWWVPFNFATAKNPHYKDTTLYGWLNVGEESQEVFPSIAESWENNHWILLNKRSTSYYRVNYDLDNWKLLTRAIISNPLQFHVHNRAQLLDDAFAFVLAKRMNFSTFLDLSIYLKKEHEYAPWVTADSYLTKLNRYLSGDSDYELFLYYVRKIVGNYYTEVGVTEKTDDEHLTKLSRSLAVNWACLANFGDCREVTKKRLQEFIKTGSKVEPNMRSSIFCNGLMEADETEYKFMLKLLMDSKDEAFRSLLISNAMGCMQNKTLLDLYLHSAIQYDDSNNYKKQERQTVLPGVLTKGPIQLAAVMDFLIANHAQYVKVPGDYGFRPILLTLTSIADKVVTEEQNKKFEELLNVMNAYPEILQASDSFRAMVKANLQWVSENRKELAGWLKSFKEKEEGGDGEGNEEGGDGASAVALSTGVLFLLAFATLQTLY